jgi:hypothetical protein
MFALGMSVVTGLALLLPSCVSPLDEGLTPIEAETAQRVAQQLITEAGKIEKPQVKIDGDPSKAVGLHAPDKAGLLLVPQKDLQESEQLAEKFKSDPGASLAYLFLYHITPVIDGKALDGSQLRSVKFTGDDGQEFTVHLLLLSVRQLSEDDYRLYAYGHEAKPLIDVRFSEGIGPGPEPVAIELKDSQNLAGRIVLTVFGKYQAAFQAKYTGD